MLDVASLRQQFPALRQKVLHQVPVYLDGPGGTQVPDQVIDAIVTYLTTCNANHGGVFTTSWLSDGLLDEGRQAVADLLNAPSADEIVFGQNMTSLTFHLSRSLGRTWKSGDRVLVTKLDHDANVSPWVLAARDAGAEVESIDIDEQECSLDMDDLRRKLRPGVRLLAITCASNAVGTMPDVKAIAQLAHQVGALVFLDAVHYAPHGLIDVQDWGCDFLACSAYKFFGPHVGILWGRSELLRELEPYKLRPVPDSLPDRWMTGTQNHEGIAGVKAAVDYLASLTEPGDEPKPREQLVQSMKAIQQYEATLAQRLLAGLAERPRFKVWGITDPAQLHRRAPTISITARDRNPQQIAEHLAAREIYVWNGNMYALGLSERLGLEEQGGFLRLGLVHYNTMDEVERLLRALDEM